MAAYSFSPEARADLHSINRYTVDVWGVRQARKYVGGLRERCAEIARAPLVARTADQVGQGLRCFRYGNHTNYFRIVPHGIHVAAILHVRQDPAIRFANDG